jgi:hypothetical protein
MDLCAGVAYLSRGLGDRLKIRIKGFLIEPEIKKRAGAKYP